MTGPARLIALAAAAIVAAAVGLFAFRAPLVEAFLTRGMIAAGLRAPSLEVARVEFGLIQIRDLRAGDPSAPDLSIAKLNAQFRLGDLITRRRLTRLEIEGAAVTVEAVDGQALRIAGLHLPSGGQGGALPFDALSVADLRIRARLNGADATAVVSGAFAPTTGGRFEAEFSSDALTLSGWKVETAKARAGLDLTPDGAIGLRADIAGNLSGFGLSLTETSLEISGEGSSWSSLLAGDAQSMSGSVEVRARTGQAPAAENPLIAGFFTVSQSSPPQFLSATADLKLAIGGGAVRVSGGDGPAFSAMSDLGARITIEAPDDRGALFERNSSRRRLAVRARVDGESLGGVADLKAEAPPGAPWRFTAAGSFGDQAIRGTALGPTQFGIEGEADGGRIGGEAVISTLIRSAELGRLAIADAPLVLRASVSADLADKSAAIDSLARECVRVARARMALEGMTNEARLVDAKFCRRDGPLATIRWGADPHVDVAGVLTAARGSYVIGATRFEGEPPSIDVVASYDPDQQLTLAEGDISGGRIVINGALIASDTNGRIRARFDLKGLSGEAALAQVKLAQNATPMQVAPISAVGTAQLNDDVLRFDYVAATTDGRKLGAGDGIHQIATGRGQTTFRSGALAFSPAGLQPAKVLLALRGVVADTYGEASGEATFVWGPKPDDFRSSGKLKLDDLRFIGPGRAVSRTVGVTGEIALASLSPLRSADVQEIRVGRVDLDALQLENGIIKFAFPGDETMQVIEAEFPWFGGRIGAYGSVASLSGQNITTDLKASDVDLGQMLDFLKVKGLSGEGTVEGTLPLAISEGRARIVGGLLSAKGPGVIRYAGSGLEAAAATGPEARLAFDILRDLRFDELTARIDGPLDGSLNFNVVFKGVNEVTTGGERVKSPVIYRIKLEAPILSLIDQARISSDFRLQLEGVRNGPKTPE